MGKAKRRRRELLAAAAPEVAERHGFDDGMLGHDLTYSVNVNEHTALSIDVVLACVRTIADLTADAMIGEYQGSIRLDSESRIVQRPMATMTRRTWVWQLAATMALYNGSYIRRRFGRDAEGVAISLEPVAPPRVNWTSPTAVYVDGQLARPDDLIWIPRMTFPTLTRELASVIRLAREAFAASTAADRVRSGYWEAGGAVGLVLVSDQDISDTVADGIANRWVTQRTTNPGRPAVLGKGAHPETMGADMVSEGASGATSRIGTSIARYFGMPAWLVNVPSEAGSLTYANASAAGLDLVRYTLRPGYAGPIEDAWSGELPGDSVTGRRVVMDLRHLTEGTILEQAQANAIATGNRPWLLPSEVRSNLHLPMDLTLDEAGAPAPAMEQIGATTNG